MKTRLTFDSVTGFRVVLTAESRSEEALLHLLWEKRGQFAITKRDMEWHETYRLTKELVLEESTIGATP